MTSTTTTLAGTPIPANHLTTAIPGNRGTLWVYGFRGHDGTARYSVVSVGALPGDSADALLDGGDWGRRLAAPGRDALQGEPPGGPPPLRPADDGRLVRRGDGMTRTISPNTDAPTVPVLDGCGSVRHGPDGLEPVGRSGERREATPAAILHTGLPGDAVAYVALQPGEAAYRYGPAAVMVWAADGESWHLAMHEAAHVLFLAATA